MSVCEVRLVTHIINNMTCGLEVHGVDHWTRWYVIRERLSSLHVRTFVIAVLLIPIVIFGLATMSRN